MIRRARMTDVEAIHALVKSFGEQGLMLPLAIGDITERLRDFMVAEENGEIVGSVALHVTWGRLVEVRSLAVRRDHQGRDLGRQLVAAAHEDARALGAQEIFVLTYIPSFFEKLGYTRVDREALPHKVWQDCVKCPKFPDCGEVALKISVEAAL